MSRHESLAAAKPIESMGSTSGRGIEGKRSGSGSGRESDFGDEEIRRARRTPEGIREQRSIMAKEDFWARKNGVNVSPAAPQTVGIAEFALFRRWNRSGIIDARFLNFVPERRSYSAKTTASKNETPRLGNSRSSTG